jgi:hypothetical protein
MIQTENHMQYGKYISNSHMHREVSKLERYFFSLKGKFGKRILIYFRKEFVCKEHCKIYNWFAAKNNNKNLPLTTAEICEKTYFKLWLINIFDTRLNILYRSSSKY